jgi:glycyl-tRNA synthetase
MESFRNHLRENQIIVPSFSQYNGFAGLQDYGIVGKKIKNNVLKIWKDIFMSNGKIHEIDTPAITKRIVLEKSGHVKRFTDPVVTDRNNVEYRADHLVEKWAKDEGKNIDTDGMNNEDLLKHIKDEKLIDQDEEKIVIRDVVLMCKTDNGNFLRPELAQGMFTNFESVYKFVKTLPFGLAQIGKSYRKEISPAPFSRLIEFTQAEIEWFFDHDGSSKKAFNVPNTILPILSRDMSPYEHKMINVNDVMTCNMAYFLVKIYEFIGKIGIHKDMVRFRQHKLNEMAHYANDCWDLEVLVDDKWLECVGCADRGCYDLKVHNVNLNRKLSKPIITKTKKVIPVKKNIGSIFGKDTLNVIELLENSSIDDIPSDYNGASINDNMYKIEEIMTKTLHEKFVPYVIEPSFGIDRLIYATLYHNFQSRQDKRRKILILPSEIAPSRFAVFPLLTNNEEIIKYTQKIEMMIKKKKLNNCYIDYTSTSIGKKYVRADEIGVSFCFTVDHQTLKDDTVTCRDLLTMKQHRIAISEL